MGIEKASVCWCNRHNDVCSHFFKGRVDLACGKNETKIGDQVDTRAIWQSGILSLKKALACARRMRHPFPDMKLQIHFQITV